MTTAEILRAAADLIEPEGAWTQGVYARGKSGREVDPEGRSAVCWCAVGALGSGGRTGAYWDAYRALRGSVGRSPTKWNDDPERTQSEVVAKLREAANLAERGEA